MNKIKALIVSLLLIVGIIMYSIVFANATSWIKLKPEEVNERAEVIVFGKYDFSNNKSQIQQTKGIFSPITFKVEKYYRGSGSNMITTGVDIFDTAWVKEVQDEGASFLLFLEKVNENSSYLVPVAGPNGMIQIVNNKAKTGNKDEDEYYDKILLTYTTRLPSLKLHKWALVALGIIIVIFCTFIVMRKIQNTRHQH